MKDNFHVPFNKAWLLGILAVPVSFLGLSMRWTYQEERGLRQVEHPSWDMIVVDYLTLFTHWQFYVAVVVCALWGALAPMRWNALLKNRSRLLWPWAVFAPAWHSLWVTLSMGANAEAGAGPEQYTAWLLGGVVGGLIGLLMARTMVVRPMRLLGNYGFYSRDLKFRLAKGDDKVVVRVRGKKVKKIEVDMADLDFTFHDDTHQKTVTYNTGGMGSINGPGGFSTVYIPGETKSFNETVYTGLKGVHFPGKPYDVDVLLTPTQCNELLGVLDALNGGAIDETKARERAVIEEANARKQAVIDKEAASKKERVLARWTKEKNAIHGREGIAGGADPFWYTNWKPDTGEITFHIFAMADGRGGYVDFQNNKREEWYGNWNAARVLPVEKPGQLMVEVSDLAYEKTHMAKRILFITALDQQAVHLWRSRIEMMSKNTSS